MAHAIGISGSGESISYELSAGEHLEPQTVTAAVDGSGAASDFVVQVTIRNAAGDILTRTRSDDVVTAGDSGEVTFAPFVRATGGAGGLAGISHLTLYATSTVTAVNGVVRSGDWWNAGSASYASSSNPGFGVIVGVTNTPQLTGFGAYSLSLHVEWEAFAGTRYIEMVSAGMFPNRVRLYGATTPEDDRQDLSVTILGSGNVPSDWTANVFQASGVDREFTPIMTGVYFPNTS